MAGGMISVRKHIRWLPEDASEPTSTIVLTSPQKRYVDIRISLDSSKPATDDPRDESMLDWAIAGTTKSEARNDPKSPGKEIGTSTFYHWIDSRTTKPEDATDEGDMYPQPDGTTLEKGAMVNPDTGNLTDYEELWDDSELSDGTPCVVLQTESEEEGCRGMVILLGEYCQGFMRVGREITLERWKKTRDGQWRREFRLGNGELPCGKELLFTSKIRVGEEVVLGGRSWKVVEAA